MDWRTSDESNRTQAGVDPRLAAHPGEPGPLAIVAVGDLAPGVARLGLGPALIRDLQVARRAGQRFGLIE